VPRYELVDVNPLCVALLGFGKRLQQHVQLWVMKLRLGYLTLYLLHQFHHLSLDLYAQHSLHHGRHHVLF
jgi:hypothetical protein